MHDVLDKLPIMTVAEFLDWPGDPGGRTFQLADGEVQAVSPASATQGTIQMTLGALICNTRVAAGSRCRVVAEPGVITDSRTYEPARTIWALPPRPTRRDSGRCPTPSF